MSDVDPVSGIQGLLKHSQMNTRHMEKANKHCSNIAHIPVLHSGGFRLQSQPGNWLFWLRVLWFSSACPANARTIPCNRLLLVVLNPYTSSFKITLTKTVHTCTPCACYEWNTHYPSHSLSLHTDWAIKSKVVFYRLWHLMLYGTVKLNVHAIHIYFFMLHPTMLPMT